VAGDAEERRAHLLRGEKAACFAYGVCKRVVERQDDRPLRHVVGSECRCQLAGGEDLHPALSECVKMLREKLRCDAERRPLG
jgi:hypothetical protein